MNESKSTQVVVLNSKKLEFRLLNTLVWTRIYVYDGVEQAFIGATTIGFLYERITEWLAEPSGKRSGEIHGDTEFVPLLTLNERHCSLGGAPDRSMLFVFDGDVDGVPLVESLSLSGAGRANLAAALDSLVRAHQRYASE